MNDQLTADIPIADLAAAIADRLRPRLPLSIELWSATDIAQYLKVGRRQVLERYAVLPGFPTPIRLPSDSGRGGYRWRAAQIVAWTESLKPRRTPPKLRHRPATD